MPEDADVMHNRASYPAVASCSSGVELDQAVVGNATRTDLPTDKEPTS